MSEPQSQIYRTVCQYEILSQPVAPVPGVPYVEQGFFLQLYNYNEGPMPLTVYYVSKPPISPAASGALRFGANLIKNNGPAEQITVNQQFNAIYFPQQTLQSRDCFIFGIQYYILPSSSVQKLGTTPTENASSRGMAQILANAADIPKLKCLATIRQVFTSYDKDGNVTEISSNAYSVPEFNAYSLAA